MTGQVRRVSADDGRGRRAQLVDAAVALLDAEGPAALTVQRLGAAVGMRGPSIYKHVRGKPELETAVAAELLRVQAEVLTSAGPDLAGVLDAYRRWALVHPHLHRFLNSRPLPRAQLPAGLEDAVAAPLLAAVHDDRDLARIAWATTNGLVDLELAGRFPDDADVDALHERAAALLGGEG